MTCQFCPTERVAPDQTVHRWRTRSAYPETALRFCRTARCICGQVDPAGQFWKTISTLGHFFPPDISQFCLLFIFLFHVVRNGDMPTELHRTQLKFNCKIYLKVSQKMQKLNILRMNKVRDNGTKSHNEATFYSSHKTQNNLTMNSSKSIPPVDMWLNWNPKASAFTNQDGKRTLLFLYQRMGREIGNRWIGFANLRDCVVLWYNLKRYLSLVLSFLDHDLCLLQLLLKQNGSYVRIVNFNGQLALLRNK